MRSLMSIAAAGLSFAGQASSVSAQTAVDPKNVRAEDVVTSPLTDINLKKRDVPLVLEVALLKLTILRACKAARVSHPQ